METRDGKIDTTVINAIIGSKTVPAIVQLGESHVGEVFLTMTALGDGSVGIQVGEEALHVDAVAFRELASWAVTVALQQDPMSRARRK